MMGETLTTLNPSQKGEATLLLIYVLPILLATVPILATLMVP
jgi:hypothetical protein